MSEKTSRRAHELRETLAPYTATGGESDYTKLSISLPTELLEVVRAAADASGSTVSATIAAALRRTIQDAEQARLDAALEADGAANLELARAYAPVAADLLGRLEW